LADAGLSPGPIDATQPEQAGKLRAALRALAVEHMAAIEQDRQITFPTGYTFTRIEPQDIQIGAMAGLTYGFAGIESGGRVAERWLTYATSDGQDLMIWTLFHSPDTPGSFPSDAEVLAFEPYLRQILAGLRLPAAGY